MSREVSRISCGSGTLRGAPLLFPNKTQGLPLVAGNQMGICVRPNPRPSFPYSLASFAGSNQQRCALSTSHMQCPPGVDALQRASSGLLRNDQQAWRPVASAPDVPLHITPHSAHWIIGSAAGPWAPASCCSPLRIRPILLDQRPIPFRWFDRLDVLTMA